MKCKHCENDFIFPFYRNIPQAIVIRTSITEDGKKVTMTQDMDCLAAVCPVCLEPIQSSEGKMNE